MLTIPSPLHPAIVHFPIVLILLGTVVAIAAMIFRRWNIPQIAAIALGLGAIGCVIAMETGEEEGELVGETGALEQVVDQHEDWAERTRNAAIMAALLATGVVLSARWPRASRVMSAATAAVALLGTWCVIQTGHYGGQLVYRHGAGVMLATNASGAAGKAAPAQPPRRHHDDD